MLHKTFPIFICLTVYTTSNSVQSFTTLNRFSEILFPKSQEQKLLKQKKYDKESLKRSTTKYILSNWETYRQKILDHPLPEGSLDFEGLTIADRDFSEISLRGANFNKCQLININFKDTDLTDASFEDTTFGLNVKLNEAILYKDEKREFKFNNSLSHIDLVECYSTLHYLSTTRQIAALNRMLGPLKLTLLDHSFFELNLKGINLQNAKVQRVGFVDSDLSYANLTNAKLLEVDLQGANLTNACLSGADLSSSNLNNVRINEKITLKQDKASPLSVKETGLSVFQEWAEAIEKGDQERINLFQKLINAQVPIFKEIPHLKLLAVNWKKLNLINANFSGIDLSDLDFTEANLQNADLSHANLTNTILNAANLNKANIRGATLSSVASTITIPNYSNSNELLREYFKYPAEYQKIVNAKFNLFRDVEDRNILTLALKDKNLCNTNFYKANLSELDFTDVNLENADLRYAILSAANLTRTNLKGAKLDKADLKSTILIGADFTGADLTEAALENACLTQNFILHKNWFNTNFNHLEKHSLKTLVQIIMGMYYKTFDQEKADTIQEELMNYIILHHT